MVDAGEKLLRSHTLRGPYTEYGITVPWSKYGPAMSLLAVPALAVEGDYSHDRGLVVTLINPMLVAAAAVALLAVLRRVGLPAAVATTAALAATILSPMLHYSTEFFTEPAVALVSLLSVLMLMRLRDGDQPSAWWLGAALAAALLLRTDSMAVLIAPALVALVWFRPGSWLPVLARVGLPLAAAGASLAVYNAYRYGSPTSFGYDNEGFTTPVLQGLHGLLLSPGKGVIWFFPLILAALVGLVPLMRRDRALGALIVALVSIRLIFFATWSSWEGGISWGPRFIVPAIVLLGVPLGSALESVTRATGRGRRRAAMGGLALLAGASAVVSVLGVAVPYERIWNDIRVAPPGLTGLAADAAVRQQTLDALWHRDGGVMSRTWSALSDDNPTPMHWFQIGRRPVGVALLTASAALWALAVWVGLRVGAANPSAQVRRPRSALTT